MLRNPATFICMFRNFFFYKKGIGVTKDSNIQKRKNDTSGVFAGRIVSSPENALKDGIYTILLVLQR